MISLFRKIRKSLLAKNQITRYMIYAVGEIFLVVVGILIALAINNWNELRKAKGQEFLLLNNTLDHLRADSIAITGVLKNTTQLKELHESLIAFAKGNLNADQLQSLNFIRRTIPQSLVTQTNNPNLANEIMDQYLKIEVIDYYSAIAFGNFVLDDFNDYIANGVRPFLGKNALHNFGNQFSDRSRNELINNEKFFKELQKPELQQVLFEAGIKIEALEIAWLNYLQPQNEKLKQAILTYLSDQ